MTNHNSTAAATDVSEFVTDLDGGVFDRKLSVALSQVAAAAMDHDKAGEVASEVVDRAQIVGGTPLVKYSRTEAALAELRKRHSGAVFDLTTTKGDQAARAARLELVTLRTSLEKQRKEFKAPALDFGRLIDSEAARITKEIEVLEGPIDKQIRADEARRAAAKAERDRIEAERVAGHRAFVATLAAYAEHCRSADMTAERILNGINALSVVGIGPEREEFEEPAKLAKAQALIAMNEAHAQALGREAEAARQEAIRVENARQAEANAREAARIAAEAAQIRRRAAELEATERRQRDEQEKRDKAERNRLREEFIKNNPPAQLQQTAAAPAPDTTTTSPGVGPMGAGQAADAAPAWLLPLHEAVLIANTHRVRAEVVQDVACAVHRGQSAEIERLRAALRTAISTLERDGDEWNICEHLRAALGPNVRANQHVDG